MENEAKTIRERANDLAIALVERSLAAIANPPSYLIGEALESELAFHYARMERLTTRDYDYAIPVTRVA